MYQLRHNVGDVIKDRYTIRAVLGAGAFGTVYRVEESIGARTITFACKEMHVLPDPQTSGDERDEALRMFQEEAYLLQTLRNPHIPAAYFESEKGVWLACPICGATFKGTKQCPEHGAQLVVLKERFYLIMDFIEGPDLEEMLTKNGGRPLDEDSVLDWGVQVCDALETVHAKGLSHRDIKPANIKLQKDSNHAMLIDFGLVKPSHVQGAYGTIVMKSVSRMGTLGYAPESPEEQRQPDARTDILALGITLYRLLTNLDPTDEGQLQIMRRGVPSGSNLSISPLTDAVVTRAIQSDRDKRYPNVVEMRRDLLAARYPVETACPWCGHVQRSAQKPTADTPCERCGRALQNAQSAAPQNSKNPINRIGKNAGSPVSSAQASTRKNVPGTTMASRVNPQQARIDELRSLISKPPVMPPHPLDARIGEIEKLLAEVGKNANSMRCPSCQKSDLQHISGQPTGKCLLCNQGQLAWRTFDETRCAVCRIGPLQEYHLTPEQVFCPVCRTAVLQGEERRKLMGLAVDDWANCPHCHAELDVENGNRARLEKWDDDPFGIGAQYGKQTLPLTEWKKISVRSDDGMHCQNCQAQWDARPEGWILARWAQDPYGVAREYANRALTRQEWTKIAHAAPFGIGNLSCGSCQAEWDFSRERGTFVLLGAPNVPAWAEKLRGRPFSAQEWTSAAQGKSTARPGWLCPSCKTEFDSEGVAVKLISTSSSTLQPSIGQIMPIPDWQRRARKLPTTAEAQNLRNELQRLQTQRADDRNHSMQSQAGLRAQQEAELLQLLKQSVMRGYVPLMRMSQNSPQGNGTYVGVNGGAARVPLRANEALRWQSPGTLCDVHIVNRQAAWRRIGDGTLLVTSERVLFDFPAQDIVVQRSLAQLHSVEPVVVQGVAVVVMKFLQEDALRVLVENVRWDISLDGRNYSMTFTPQELVEIILQQQLTP